MTNKQKGVGLIVGPILFYVIISLLNFITQAIFHKFFEENNLISFIEYVIQDIFMALAFISLIVFIPSVIVGIVFINKKMDDGKIWRIFQKKIMILIIGIITVLGVTIDIGMNCNIEQDIVCDREKRSSPHYTGGGTYESFLPIKIKNGGKFIMNGNIHISQGDTVEIEKGIIMTSDPLTRIDWGDGQTEKSNEHTYLIPGNYTIQAGRYMGIVDGVNSVYYAKVIVSGVK